MTDNLPDRMRAAADALDEASRWKQLNDDSKVPWTAVQLRFTADHIEAEDAAAEHEAMVEELAQVLVDSWVAASQIQSRRPLFDDARDSARKLIDNGWRKTAVSSDD